MTHTLRALAALLLLAPAALRAQETGIAVGAMAPDAEVVLLDGTPARLSRWIGKGPVVIEFWATWCPLCRALEPRFAAAKAKHGTGVTFLGIGVAENQSAERQAKYVADKSLAGTFLFDREGKAVAAFKVPHTSYVVVLDRGGRVVYTGVGADQDLEAAIAKAGVPRAP